MEILEILSRFAGLFLILCLVIAYARSKRQTCKWSLKEANRAIYLSGSALLFISLAPFLGVNTGVGGSILWYIAVYSLARAIYRKRDLVSTADPAIKRNEAVSPRTVGESASAVTTVSAPSQRGEGVRSQRELGLSGATGRAVLLFCGLLIVAASLWVLFLGGGIRLRQYYGSGDYVLHGQVLTKDGTESSVVPGADVSAFPADYTDVADFYRRLEGTKAYQMSQNKFEMRASALGDLPSKRYPSGEDWGEDQWRRWHDLTTICRDVKTALVNQHSSTPIEKIAEKDQWAALRAALGVASTHTDSNGLFELELKAGTYVIIVGGDVPVEYAGRWRRGRTEYAIKESYAVWAEPVKIPRNTRLVMVMPFCSP